MIFDIEMEDFCCKATLVTGRHMPDPQDIITYERVVSRDTESIALTLDAMNDFPVKVEDIQNTYITVPFTEKIWKVLTLGLGDDAGRKARVVKNFVV